MVYAEPVSESEEAHFLSSSGDGEISTTGLGKEETMVSEVTKREEKKKRKQEEERDQLVACKQRLNEEMALRNKKAKKPSQLERFRERERAEKAQEQDRQLKITNSLLRPEEPAQLQFRKQAEAEEEERGKVRAQLRKGQQVKVIGEEEQRTVENEKAVEKKQVEKQQSQKLNSGPDDHEEDIMTQLNLLSVTLRDKTKRVFRQSQWATESYIQVIILNLIRCLASMSCNFITVSVCSAHINLCPS